LTGTSFPSFSPFFLSLVFFFFLNPIESQELRATTHDDDDDHDDNAVGTSSWGNICIAVFGGSTCQSVLQNMHQLTQLGVSCWGSLI
jgi:hypothetical protein